MPRTDGTIYCHDGPLAGMLATVEARSGYYRTSYVLAVIAGTSGPYVVSLDGDPTVLDVATRDGWQVYRREDDDPGPDGEPGYRHCGLAATFPDPTLS